MIIEELLQTLTSPPWATLWSLLPSLSVLTFIDKEPVPLQTFFFHCCETNSERNNNNNLRTTVLTLLCEQQHQQQKQSFVSTTTAFLNATTAFFNAATRSSMLTKWRCLITLDQHTPSTVYLEIRLPGDTSTQTFIDRTDVNITRTQRTRTTLRGIYDKTILINWFSLPFFLAHRQ